MTNEIVLYQPDNTIQLEVRLQNETVWLNQQQMVALFDSTKSNISMHISNIFKEGELQKEATVQDFLTVQNEGGRQVTRRVRYYNLDVIISVILIIIGTGYVMWVRSISFDAKNAGWNCNVMMRHIALMEENAMMEASINGFVHTETKCNSVKRQLFCKKVT